LAAVETVNRPGDHMLARRILARPPELTPADAQQAGFNLKAWEQGRTLERTA
jgi:3-phenylpropionate/trans-cinnamate dioxygenase ferredoxin reductase component